MVRISKQSERRQQSPRRPRIGSQKTGAKKDNLEGNFKKHANALDGEFAKLAYIPKIK